MHSKRLEKRLQKLSDALSEFDDALVDVQTNSVPGPTESDIRRRRLIIEIDNQSYEVIDPYVHDTKQSIRGFMLDSSNSTQLLPSPKIVVKYFRESR